MTGDKDISQNPDETSPSRPDDKNAVLMRAVSGASDGIALIDPDGRFVYLNPALARMFHLDQPLESYIGQPWQNIYAPEGVAEIEGYILPLLNREKAWRGEATVARWDGTCFFAELTMDQLPDNSIIATARDIGERLEREKNNEAMQQKLFQTQKMEALGRLSGGIAHEFNNILAAIIGYADFLAMDLEDGSDEQNYARRISQAGQRGQDLVSMMMSFTHPDRADVEIVQLDDYLHSLEPMICTALGSRIEHDLKLFSEGVCVQIDRSRISESLLHLCNNAVDAIGDAGGKIEIQTDITDLSRRDLQELMEGARLQNTRIIYSLPKENDDKCRMHVGQLDPKQQYATISVRDTGPGIAPDVMAHMLDPFFTTRAPGYGSGLGLPAVVAAIGMHRGAMLISSQKGKGTQIELFIPTVPVDGRSNDEKSKESEPKCGVVLIIEPDDGYSGPVIRAIEDSGFEVVCCLDDQEFQEVVSEIVDGWHAVLIGPSLESKMQVAVMRGVDGLENRPRVVLQLGSADTPADIVAQLQSQPD